MEAYEWKFAVGFNGYPGPISDAFEVERRRLRSEAINDATGYDREKLEVTSELDYFEEILRDEALRKGPITGTVEGYVNFKTGAHWTSITYGDSRKTLFDQGPELPPGARVELTEEAVQELEAEPAAK